MQQPFIVVDYRKKFWYLGLIFIVLGIILGLALLLNPNYLSNRNSLFLFLFIFSLFILLILISLKIVQSTFPLEFSILHPPILIILWVIVLIVIPGIFTFTSFNTIAKRLYITLDINYFLLGLFYVWIGCAIIFVTYYTILRIIRPFKFATKISSRNSININIVFLLYLITVLISFLVIRFVGIRYGEEMASWGVFSPFRQWVIYFINLQALFISIIAIITFRKRIGWTMFVIIVLFQSLLSISSGFIKPLYEFGIIIFLSALVAQVKKKYLVITLILIVLITIFIMPVTDNIREGLERNVFNPRNFSDVFEASIKSISYTWFTNFTQSLESAFDKIVYRQGLISHSPGIIIQKTPTIFPFEGIEKFFLIPFYILPRALWVDKPILSRGVWFGIKYLNEPSSTTTSSAMTFIGEGYIFSGLIGIIIVGLSIGIILALLYKNTQFIGLAPIYISLAPVFLNIEGEYTGMVINLVQQSILSFLVYWLIQMIGRYRKSV